MMYVYAIGSIFTFLCMILGVLFGQLMSGGEPRSEPEELLDVSEEEQEEIEEIIEKVKNADSE